MCVVNVCGEEVLLPFQKNILRLEVAVNDATVLQDLESFDKLLGKDPDEVSRQS